MNTTNPLEYFDSEGNPREWKSGHTSRVADHYMCDICQWKLALVDGRTAHGSWAHMCRGCYSAATGNSEVQTGHGIGQILISPRYTRPSHRPVDMQWMWRVFDMPLHSTNYNDVGDYQDWATIDDAVQFVSEGAGTPERAHQGFLMMPVYVDVNAPSE